MDRSIFWGVFITYMIGMTHIAFYDIREKWRSLKDYRRKE